LVCAINANDLLSYKAHATFLEAFLNEIERSSKMSLQVHARTIARGWVGAIMLAAFSAASTQAIAQSIAQSEQQDLVNSAETTFSNFTRDPDMTWLQHHLGDAKAIVIAPMIVKAGWIFGGAGGRAVVFARNSQTGRWVGPAFYNIGAASVGFQAGLSLSETLTLVMTDKGLNSLLASSVKLGGDASIAAGPIGAGANSDITTDFVAFSRSKGIYGGLNLEGSVIAVANDWNRSYYGGDVLPPDILVRASAHNPQADRLAGMLDRAIRTKTSSTR
jgi:lipid-binding SYLF domain-containing protein